MPKVDVIRNKFKLKLLKYTHKHKCNHISVIICRNKLLRPPTTTEQTENYVIVDKAAQSQWVQLFTALE